MGGFFFNLFKTNPTHAVLPLNLHGRPLILKGIKGTFVPDSTTSIFYSQYFILSFLVLFLLLLISFLVDTMGYSQGSDLIRLRKRSYYRAHWKMISQIRLRDAPVRS